MTNREASIDITESSEHVGDESTFFRGTKWLLTYTHYTADPDELLRALQAVGGDIKEAMISHETGENGQHPHTHVYVHFTKMLQKRVSRWADFDGVHPHIRRINRSKADRLRVIRYLAKEDEEPFILNIPQKDLEQPKTYKMSSLLQKYSNPYEAALANGELRDVHAIKTVFELKAQIDDDDTGSDCSEEIELYDWQRRLLDKLDKKADRRKVLWRWEPVGGAGKTTFANWLEDRRDAITLESVNYKDIARIMYNLKHVKRWKGNIVVFDLRRQMEDWEGVYGVIESVKNGRITSGKYDSQVVKFKRKFHVVVFANWAPDRNALSADRWDIERIDGKPDNEGVIRHSPEPLE